MYAGPSSAGGGIEMDVFVLDTYDTIWVQKGRLVADIGIPTTATSRDQLLALAKLVLDRSAEYQ